MQYFPKISKLLFLVWQWFCSGFTEYCHIVKMAAAPPIGLYFLVYFLTNLKFMWIFCCLPREELSAGTCRCRFPFVNFVFGCTHPHWQLPFLVLHIINCLCLPLLQCQRKPYRDWRVSIGLGRIRWVCCANLDTFIRHIIRKIHGMVVRVVMLDVSGTFWQTIGIVFVQVNLCVPFLSAGLKKVRGTLGKALSRSSTVDSMSVVVLRFPKERDQANGRQRRRAQDSLWITFWSLAIKVRSQLFWAVF